MTNNLNTLTAKFILMTSFLLSINSGCVQKGESAEDMSVESSKAETSNSDFRNIFNGMDLSGWEGDSRFWSVEDSVIVGETAADNPTEINTFLIWEEDEPSDFEIQFKYRFVIVSDDEYGNSGLQLRSERVENEDFPEYDYSVQGYQTDMAISDWIPGIHYEEGKRGIIARRGQKVLIDSEGEMHEDRFATEEELGEYIEHTEWNDYHVYANADTIRASINNQLMHELIDQSAVASDEGLIAFQVHAGPPMRIEFRDIEIKNLN
ncbi:MAG: 3-keto-disaccharide hydrolase [Bacteroidota bacterium]